MRTLHTTKVTKCISWTNIESNNVKRRSSQRLIRTARSEIIRTSLGAVISKQYTSCPCPTLLPLLLPLLLLVLLVLSCAPPYRSKHKGTTVRDTLATSRCPLARPPSRSALLMPYHVSCACQLSANNPLASAAWNSSTLTGISRSVHSSGGRVIDLHETSKDERTTQFQQIYCKA